MPGREFSVGKMNSEQRMTLVGVILQSNLMAFEDFVILEASLSARVFDFDVRNFRAQSELYFPLCSSPS